MKKILTIAGSDSGGGAGIQADLKAITVLGGYGSSVITALTAQNTLGVQGIHDVPVDFIKLQMDAVLTDIGADAAKTGMLATSEVVRCVAEGLRKHQVKNLVVDPVMVAASGDPLLAREAVETVKKELLPLADLVTPNLYEASIISGLEVKTIEDMKAAAEIILRLGPKGVLIKGGHLTDPEDRAVDLLFDGRSMESFSAARIETRNTHGTGCTLSAALAVFLARGLPMSEAVRRAKDFMTAAIRNSLDIGGGHGPTNPYIHIQGLAEREAVLDEMREALAFLLLQPLGKLIPEIRTNLGYALPGAQGPKDVAAVPGRVSQIGDRLVAFAEPAYGASSHVAKVVLAAMNHDPQTRSAMAVRYSHEALAACRAMGLSLASFDRAEEPKEVKEREGSSLEWGTKRALEGLTHTPDAIYDEGEKGKEPVIRILGKNPRDVVEKVIGLAKQMQLPA